MQFVDSHCHIDFPDFQARTDAVISAMQEAGVTHALCVSVDIENFPRVLALAERFPAVYASVVVHPDHDEGVEPDVDLLVSLADHPRVVAIGETGLDFYRHPDRAEAQKSRFAQHIEAARRTGKPLIIHTRSASDDTIAMMRAHRADEAGGVMHCFTETWEVARASLELGFHISFSGIVTFKSAQDLREVAARVPLDRLLIETDSPYLAPVPHRGKTNEPAFVPHVARCVAEVRGEPVERIAEATRENFFRLFRHAQA